MLKSSIGVRRSSPSKILRRRAFSNGHASSGVIPVRPIVFPRLLKAAWDRLADCSSDGNENMLVVDAVGGPKTLVDSRLLGPTNSPLCSIEKEVSRRGKLAEEFERMGVKPAAAAFSSLFFSRNARPPCRRSRPLTVLAKLEEGPGDCGAKEYKGWGADGSTACELDEAEESGRLR